MPKKGKKGVDQRVKGNVKAASSGRMADLLGGESATGFIGFEAVSRGMGGEEEEGEGEGEGEGAVDKVPHGAGAEFQVVMKQLGKRDTTTKLKALQEFSVLCERESLEAVVSVLNIWSLMYNKLSTDNDNRVREASHKALLSCVNKVKGSLRPHFRSMVGSWVSGMCDPHGSAASAAQAAFSAAFTPPKQTDALKFGFKAIINFVEDITLKQTQDTFSDPKVVPEDERLQRYERIVAMCLYGLSFTLQRLPEEHIREKQEEWESFLVDKRLWKLARHRNPQIRASSFTVVATLCKQAPEFIRCRGKQFCSLVLSSLGESEPVVVGPLWEAALLVVMGNEDWSQHVNVQKALLPGLWQLLSGGGHGSARVAYPCLLPLLRKLVEQVYQSDVHFATSFIERLKSGLQADSVRGSVSECEVVLQTFNQAFLYLLLHVDTEGEGEKGRKQFYRGMMNMVVDLLEYSVGQCPRTQATVVSGWVGRLLDDLLRTGSTHPWMEPYLQGWLQDKLTEKMLALLEGSTDKAQFSRLGSLLSSLNTNHWKPTANKRVTFAGGEEESTPTSEAIPGSGDQGTPEEREEVLELSLNARRSFLRPAVASLCAQCLARVCQQQSLEHSMLLCEALGLYGDRETVVNIHEEVRTRFPSLLLDEGERDGGSGGGREGEGGGGGQGGTEGEEEKGERGGEEITRVVVSLCGRLLKVVAVDSSRRGNRQLVEGVVSSILLLLQTQLVTGSVVKAFLDRMVVENPSVLPLLLTKLGEARGHPEWVRFLLQQRQPQLLDMVVGGGSREEEEEEKEEEEEEEAFLWSFLDLSLATPGYFDSEEGVRMKTEVFESICKVLRSTFREQRPSNTSRTRKLLHTLSRATPEVVEEFFTQRPSGGHEVLQCLLNWCLNNCRSEASLLTEISSCYSHLIALLPEPASYLESTANHLISLVDTQHGELERVLDMAMAVHVLHSPALASYSRFWSLYQPLLTHIATDNDRFLPLAALESFCSSQPYSPFFEELSSDRVITSLSGPWLSILFLASALCDPAHMSKVLSSLSSMALLSALESQEVTTSMAAAFPLHESGEGERSCYQLWKDLVCEVMLAICALRPSLYEQHSPVEIAVASLLHSTLERCLGIGFGEQEWCRRLLKELISRASADGPLWSLVLQTFFASVEKTLGDNHKDTLSDLLSMVFEEPEAPLVLAAVKGLSRRGRAECKGHLMGSIRGRESDVCLLAVCLHLFPATDDIISLARNALSEVAAKHANSEITLFDNLEESVQDPLSFSLLELTSHLTTAGTVPSNAWELILCSLVTIVQFLSDASAQHRPSVNFTVFYCKAMQACSQTARFLSSPLAPSDQASEWKEFFCPDIEHCLLPAYLSCATQSGPESPSYCHIHQHLYLCKAVAEMCTNLNTVSLEVLIDILMSSLYPFKVTAFFLAKRFVATVEFFVEVSTALPPEKLTAISITTIKELLGRAVEHVNLDLTFLEDTQDVSGYHGNTSSYLLLWLLIIEVMSHCSPEARASLGEWLKELSLFNHLLHGLFKYLSDTDSSLKNQLEVTLLPDLETLSTVLYSTVARHLPSMLRQWYLSLDRATSAIVTQFTTKHISPALQQTELQSVGKTSTTHGNLEVRAYAGASEVSVVYRIHEFSIELFVYLPDNYPLQPPSIREGRRVRVEASQWRKWMLQLNVFVTNQNGTLMDGLLLWKSNLDKHFSGVEDCMICFSVIHSSLYSLPKMTCRTCKKKFHSACLYKWFSTSNKSSCPLCRNIF